MTAQKNILILGSTGSIGKSTLDIINSNKDSYKAWGLVAGSNFQALEEQINNYNPCYAGLAKDSFKKTFTNTKIVQGEDEIISLCSDSHVDIVVIAIVGMAALKPALAAAKAGKTILLANKESLVCAGGLLIEEVKKNQAKLIPVDSEHSAIFQLLKEEHKNDLRKVILTASGGPFLNSKMEELLKVTPEQAVKHPRWSMGKKISVDSATLMNKALEVIEAKWLFDLKDNEIEVIIHPESIVHSFVEFIDGIQYAHLSIPDMKGPISYALAYPKRIKNAVKALNLAELGSLTFISVDNERFQSIKLAKSVLKSGGNSGAVLNLANEVAVEAFLAGKIPFLSIVSYVSEALEVFGDKPVQSIDYLYELEKEIKSYLLKQFS